MKTNYYLLSRKFFVQQDYWSGGVFCGSEMYLWRIEMNQT